MCSIAIGWKCSTICKIVTVLSGLVTTTVDNDDLAMIQGKWRVVSVHANGELLSEKQWEVNDILDFVGNRVAGLYTGDFAAVSFIELKPNTKPTQFLRLVDGDEGEKRYLTAIGILSITGDTLTICSVLPGKKLPDSFDTRKGDHRTLIVCKRLKEA